MDSALDRSDYAHSLLLLKLLLLPLLPLVVVVVVRGESTFPGLPCECALWLPAVSLPPPA